jgi:hypothetical protein
VSGYYTPARYHNATHVARKLKKREQRTCQRCARLFEASRDVPYCWSCFREKRKERLAAYIGRELERAGENRPGCERAED